MGPGGPKNPGPHGSRLGPPNGPTIAVFSSTETLPHAILASRTKRFRGAAARGPHLYCSCAGPRVPSSASRPHSAHIRHEDQIPSAKVPTSAFGTAPRPEGRGALLLQLSSPRPAHTPTSPKAARRTLCLQGALMALVALLDGHVGLRMSSTVD